jgi:hypothetical protein
MNNVGQSFPFISTLEIARDWGRSSDSGSITSDSSDAAYQHPDRKEEGVGGGIFVARDGAVVLTVKVAVPERSY